MTCAGCGRDVTLLGTYCGQCQTKISSAVADAVDVIDEIDGTVHDVFQHTDGYFHIRIDREETDET